MIVVRTLRAWLSGDCDLSAFDIFWAGLVLWATCERLSAGTFSLADGLVVGLFLYGAWSTRRARRGLRS